MLTFISLVIFAFLSFMLWLPLDDFFRKTKSMEYDDDMFFTIFVVFLTWFILGAYLVSSL